MSKTTPNSNPDASTDSSICECVEPSYVLGAALVPSAMRACLTPKQMRVRFTPIKLPRVALQTLACSLLILSSTFGRICRSEELPAWFAPKDSNAIRIDRVELPDAASSAYRFRIQNAGPHSPLVFRSPRTPSQLHNDYQAKINVVASIAGLRSGLIILLPNQIDPRTGKPLQTIVRGDILREIDVEKQLVVKATKQAIEFQLRSLRAELHQPNINAQGAIVVGIAIMVEATPGEQFVEIRDSECGPVVAVDNEVEQMAANVFGTSNAVSPEVRNYVPLDISLDSIQLNHKPTILRIAPDHGESIEMLQQMGLNTIWVHDFRQAERARELYESKFAVLVTPPHPEFEPGDFKKLLQGLPPLDQLCPSGSGWILGTRVSREDLEHLLAWSREVRSGDRKFQRPQLADVTEAEGAAAREIDLIGIGRHVVGRPDSFGELRNLLFRRRRSGGQLPFPWTWIQIEPSSTQQAWRKAMGLQQPFVEPEQIQHQVYAAVSAGCKGLGFWKTSPLDPQDPLDQETAIAIELACLEIELLEPFLARGRLDGHLSLQSASEKQAAAMPAFGRKPPSAMPSALGSGNISTSAGSSAAPAGSDAAVITSSRAMLILPTYWDESSQIVPGPMYERSIELTVAATETASAYQISTTGIRYIPRDVTAGGLRVKIDNFDRCAAILVSSDQELIGRIRASVLRLAERSATQSAKLANLKYLRVMQVVESLREGHRVAQGVDALLAAARRELDRAEREVASRDFEEVAARSNDCLRILRQVQQACWNDAIAELSAPGQSPHALSFTTLPEHWKLMHYVDRQQHRISENLLPSGDFENVQLFSEDGWQQDTAADSSFYCTTDLVHDPTGNNTVLQLKAVQSRSGVTTDSTPLTLSTPAVMVNAGDVVLVQGRIRKGRTVTGTSPHPVLIFDSDLGPEGGLRPKLTQEWQTFEMIRPIAAASEFRISVAITGQAEIQLDDVALQVLPPLEPQKFLQLTGEEKELP